MRQPHVVRHKEYLKLLTKSRGQSKRCRHLIDAASKGEINSLAEACMNILEGNIGKHDVKKLQKYKNKIRKVACKSTKLAHKKKTLQSGGFLGAILPVIASVVGSLLGGIGK